MGVSSLGFGAEVRSPKSLEAEALYSKVTHQDLVKFGLIPELVGRLPVITPLQSMDKDILIRIMTEPKNSIIKQYKALFAMDNVELDFEDSALSCIAEMTVERKTGARGLRSIIEGVLQDIMFETPSDDSISKIIISADTVNGSKPVIINK